ncbi:ornithine carbamoyltransferase [Methanomicrobium sp. W14]|uniref:ornithine carbamoyltransferase n=1 Tax=Methanomicrobium sp. W14 TaxID=2817839 RepID=UPI001AE96244|nr:ornithine carbamoyltransferase [Methanomicrobium sp. W14]MBP2132275.1 ornithine carbamoyltransferase [Methanomicrobium sp. W14]
MKKDILSVTDLTKQEFADVLNLASDLKEKRKKGILGDLLYKKSLGMIFEKASTRTRISFETGMFELGGHAIFLNPNDMQLGRGEEIKDTARVLSGYLSAIMVRSFYHKTVEEIAKYATVPVINGLSDKEHPCQILADVMTMRETFGEDLSSLKVAWIGDGNNVCNSLILSSLYTRFEVRVSTPKGYGPDGDIVKSTIEAGGNVRFFESPDEAVLGSDVIYTDTWISMGSENEKEKRLRDFSGYCVSRKLMEKASPKAVVMHCLPAHRGEEITDEVIEGKNSIVWRQAENRLHAQKALLVKLLHK